MNPYDYPYIVLKELEVLYINIRKIVVEKSDFIKMTTDEPFNILITGGEPNVYYKVLKAGLRPDGKIQVHITFSPKSEIDPAQHTVLLDSKLALNHLSKWVKLIELYSALKLTPEETLLKHYEDEFYQQFEILSEEAAIEPFKLPQQRFLYRYLEYVEETLSNEADKGTDTEDLRSEVTTLKEELTNLTQSATMRKMSRLLALFRKKGLGILSKIWDEALKETIKKGINYTSQNHELITQKLHEFFVS
ncbi:MAG TPA: hypothetical protein VF610_06140 [Segetibacter sp.]